MLFGLQLVDYRQFDAIVAKIEKFRIEKAQNEGNYKKFRARYLEQELRDIYSDDISSGNTKTRETNDASITKFLRTKASNMRDYADACFRYLRATGLVNISHFVITSYSIHYTKLYDVERIPATGTVLKKIDFDADLLQTVDKYLNGEISKKALSDANIKSDTIT